MNLVTKDPATGKISQAEKRNIVRAGAVPFFLVYLLMMVVLFGSAPQLGAVAEDKMQRVFEMLLGSAHAFELMMREGSGCAGSVADQLQRYTSSPGLRRWREWRRSGWRLSRAAVVFRLSDCGRSDARGLGVAMGSACGSPQDAQHLAFGAVHADHDSDIPDDRMMQQPNGVFATAMSFVPPFTPMMMLMRQALPNGRAVVAAVGGAGGRDHLGHCGGVGRGANFSRRHFVARQGPKIRGAGAMGGARRVTRRVTRRATCNDIRIDTNHGKCRYETSNSRSFAADSRDHSCVRPEKVAVE